jgi:hypothetical protein
MTDQQHPITPPPELLQQLCNNPRLTWLERLCFAYAAGADQGLEACCEWLRSKDILEPAIDALRVACRSKPPSLKEQALEALGYLQEDEPNYQSSFDTIRRALEQLND